MKLTRFFVQPALRPWLARSLFAVAASAAIGLASPSAHAGVFVSVNFAPPALPIYEQPPIPAPGYLWTPGYWAYDAADGYYWVPGTWVLPPYSGALWTPGYWGWGGGVYAFHAGYWGLHVGYYGGINYGFGYVGVGYAGGYWGEHGFCYNRAVNHIDNVHVTNVYSRTVVNNTTINRASFNGPGGILARPTPGELAVEHEAHTAASAAQIQHQTLASQNQLLRASVNHGTPTIAATARPGAFSGRTVAAGNHSVTSAAGSASLRSASYVPHSTAAGPGAVNRTAPANNRVASGNIADTHAVQFNSAQSRQTLSRSTSLHSTPSGATQVTHASNVTRTSQPVHRPVSTARNTAPHAPPPGGRNEHSRR